MASHLAALQADGLVARQRAGSRRPSVVYALTPAAIHLFPKAYDEFAATMLDELQREGPGHLRRVLWRIADRWIARDLPRVEGLTGRRRWERAKEILAERGFMPVLNKDRDGYLLQEYNCPAMKLAVAHPEVCDMVHRWLEALFGTPLKRTHCLRQGDPYSAYVIQAVGQKERAFSKQSPGATHGRGQRNTS
ncbi:MAG: hypothetical protein QN168_10300 [Armatimonadota bacterium]|nr:hypothetical protein [Armatimonadota bacterium]